MLPAPPQLCAIVTGHSRGLGAAITHELLQRGIPTLGLARGANDGLSARFGTDPGLFTQVTLDLSDPEALRAWLAGPKLGSWVLGRELVLLFNNAATIEPVGPLPLQDGARIAQAVALNVTAPLLLSAALSQTDNGAPNRQLRIAHVSSGAARHAYPGWSVYCATKSALDMHAQGVAMDAVPGLRICSLAPGVIDTEMQAQIRASDPAAFPQLARFEALKREGRLSAPEDCARELVQYVLSEDFGSQAVADLRDLA